VTLLAGQKIMVINADTGRQWQRVTMAHELGHYLAGHLYLPSTRLNAAWLPPDDELEREANTVAARLLIPQWLIDDGLSVDELAERCDVPTSLVRLRLPYTSPGELPCERGRVSRRDMAVFLGLGIRRFDGEGFLAGARRTR
jgi:Zn-dependent peptidase ImmA (M78 family)